MGGGGSDIDLEGAAIFAKVRRLMALCSLPDVSQTGQGQNSKRVEPGSKHGGQGGSESQVHRKAQRDLQLSGVSKYSSERVGTVSDGRRCAMLGALRTWGRMAEALWRSQCAWTVICHLMFPPPAREARGFIHVWRTIARGRTPLLTC